jgi:hypothetical protein
MVPPAAMYGILNIASATGIVFANKAVFAWHAFSFPYALTFVHTLVTYVGMQIFLRWGVFEGRKDILSKGEGVKVRTVSSIPPSALFFSSSPSSPSSPSSLAGVLVCCQRPACNFASARPRNEAKRQRVKEAKSQRTNERARNS